MSMNTVRKQYVRRSEAPQEAAEDLIDARGEVENSHGEILALEEEVGSSMIKKTLINTRVIPPSAGAIKECTQLEANPHAKTVCLWDREGQLTGQEMTFTMVVVARADFQGRWTMRGVFRVM